MTFKNTFFKGYRLIILIVKITKNVDKLFLVHIAHPELEVKKLCLPTYVHQSFFVSFGVLDNMLLS